MADNNAASAASSKRRSRFATVMGRLLKEKRLGAAGAVITVLLLFTGIFADFIAPYGMNEIQDGHYLEAPSIQYPLGTDNIGRDVLSRVVYGARISLIVGVASTCISVSLSAVLGMLCGYLGGKFDLLVQRFVDAWMCIPGLVLLMLMVSVLGNSMLNVIVVLGLKWGISGSRVVRGATIAVKQNVYIKASVVVGCSTTRIFLRHILPNIMPILIILFASRMPAVILAEAGLSFLGYGLPPPTPSWGGMISGSGMGVMLRGPWMVLWPGIALSIVVFGVNLFGDALRDLLDPRLRGGVGRLDGRVRRRGAPAKTAVAPGTGEAQA